MMDELTLLQRIVVWILPVIFAITVHEVAHGWVAKRYGDKIRMNAIAPGFFLTEQNRFLLTDKETGQYTPRGQSVITHTPLARFGDPQELVGAVLWLLSPAASFVHGVVVPIDGGFSAFSGV